MRRVAFALVFLLALPAFAGKSRAIRSSSGPTFTRDIAPLLQDHCQSCHRPNNIAPMSLMTYRDAKPYASLIKVKTLTKEMPPWKPGDGCGDFADRRGLSPAQIDLLTKWADNGAPEGDPDDLPPAREFSDDWDLGTPDLVLTMPQAFTAPAGTDTYRCFTIPSSLVADQYVSAVDTHPGDRETVHHVLTFIDTSGESAKLDEAEPGPGYTCFGGPGFNNPGTLGGWAPGAPPLQLPSGIAMELPANSRVVMQVHYHPHHGTPEPDQTELGIYFSKEKPKKLMRIIPLINQSFTIPPNDANYKVTAQWPILTPVAMHLWLIAPHMHLLGRTMRVEMTPPGGPAQCLIDIGDWDFHWQGAYRYREAVAIPALSKLSLVAYYDNSSGNPRNPNDPPKAVSWGEQTTDEMCIAFLGVTLDYENLP
ncbi:MAG TPA: ascorbate-dependent monooxygenase [Thermoanaerobaculia bacterium]|nr:ascorbate-dependent monooxygenase [Thermoanaerobaculia bacterium]